MNPIVHNSYDSSLDAVVNAFVRSLFSGSAPISYDNTTGVISFTGGGGGVTAVTGTAPVASSGGATPDISMHVADATHDGYLAQGDWSAFNNKLGSVTADIPLSGSGTSGSHLVIADAAADGATKGAAAFATNDFNATSGVISIDYTNGQAASAVNKGFLTSADWSAFNGKQSALGYTPVNKAGDTMSGNLFFSDDNEGVGQSTGVPGGMFLVHGSDDIGAIPGDVTVRGGDGNDNGGDLYLRGGTAVAGPAGNVIFSQLTASRALALGASKEIVSSATTAAELATLSGVTATPTASKVPIASASGKLDGWITTADSTHTGLLTSTDWSTFNGKQAALGFTPINKAGDNGIGTLILDGNLGVGAADPLADSGSTLAVMLNTGDDIQHWYDSGATLVAAVQGSGTFSTSGGLGLWGTGGSPSQPSDYTVSNDTPTRTLDNTIPVLATTANVLATLLRDLATYGIVPVV